MYKKVLFLAVAFVLTFSLAVGTQASVIKSDGNLSATINSGFAGANANNPTGVRGQTNVKIASFILLAPYKNIIVDKIVLKNSSDAALALGKDFQNLHLMNNGSQIALTIGALSQTASATYTIYPTGGINIPAGGQYVVDVYADSLTSAININRAYSAVLLDSVWGINAPKGSKIGWGTRSNKSGEKDIAGQNIYIADKGSLLLVSSPNAPVDSNVVMGLAGYPLGLFELRAGPEEDIYLTKIVLTDVTTSAGSIVNLKLMKDGVQYGPTVASLVGTNNNSSATAVFNGVNLTIPKNQSRKILLLGDINIYPYAVSGSAHQFKIAFGTDILAVGQTSGQIINADNGLTVGGVLTVCRSKLMIYNAMGNVAGGQGFSQQIGKYTFTNYSPGNYPLTISDIDLGIATTINNIATTSVKLYKDYPGGTLIAEKWFVGGADFSTINNWDSFAPFTIDAVDGYGQTNIFVVADTIYAMPTNFITTWVGDVTWSDGITPEIIGLTPNVITTISGATTLY